MTLILCPIIIAIGLIINKKLLIVIACILVVLTSTAVAIMQFVLVVKNADYIDFNLLTLAILLASIGIMINTSKE